MPSAITASVPMAMAAALLNDSAQTKFTNTVLLPYLQIAYSELQESLEENNISATNEVSAVIPVTTVMTDIGGNTGPALPADLVEIQFIEERTTGSSEDFGEMIQVEYLPPYVTKTATLVYWAWQNQVITLLGATTNRDVRINYIGLTMGSITGPNSNIALFQAKLFLGWRTAGLAARFTGEDIERATECNSFAGMSIERLLNINSKGKQSIATRRRPFMASYKATRLS